MENKFLEDYEEQDYLSASDEFIKKTQLYLSENREHIVMEMLENMNRFFEKLAGLQQDVPIGAGSITLSLLHTSIYFGNPQIRIDAYDKYGVFGGNILTEYWDIPWLFLYWSKYEEDLTEAVKKKHYENDISGEQIRVLMCQKVPILLYLLIAQLKYPFERIDSLEWFPAVQREENFAVSIGEYRDWQKTVYLDTPVADIFLNVEGKPLLFQKYTQLIYKNKTFDSLDLSHVRFTDCHFADCVIKQVKFHDVSFLGCRFHNVAFENCQFYGSYWKGCLIQKTRFSGSGWWKEMELDDEPIHDFYREVWMESCSFHRVVMEDCGLSHVKVTDEHMTDVEILESGRFKEGEIIGGGQI